MMQIPSCFCNIAVCINSNINCMGSICMQQLQMWLEKNDLYNQIIGKSVEGMA